MKEEFKELAGNNVTLNSLQEEIEKNEEVQEALKFLSTL